ncbi:PIG-L deacetylase family protein [Pseudohoeflea coraliihabitans]|uniref:PIG-L family deacetylase n=1 Tax=Pseudohoeflea coraliihabitans TaxID=2860393 RepID=A0ABS6WL76_9HYPH|nr:PIG-L family deacetylase [Pseudohoeflea sp. DP4N28-3]
MKCEGALLDAAQAARHAGIAELTGRGGVLVLAPHPDDETLGCGAAIAAARASGRTVTVVVVTDGSRSHRASRRWPAKRLAAERYREACRALAVLTDGSGELVWLGFEDTQAPTRAQARAEVAGQLADLVRRRHITALWSSWGKDPHCDHAATAQIAAALHRHCPQLLWFSYPIWGRFDTEIDSGSLPERTRLRLFDSTCHKLRKSEALSQHRTQMSDLIDDDPDGFVMEREMQAHFIGTPEIFIREFSDATRP